MLWVFHEVIVRGQWLQSSEGLSEAGDLPKSLEVSAGSWEEDLVLLHVDLSIGFLEHPQDMADGFYQRKLSKCAILWLNIGSHRQSHVQYSVVPQVSSDSW